MRTAAILALFIPALVAANSRAQDAKSELIAIKAGRIFTISKGIIEEGVILIEKGKIKKVGKGISVPLEAKVIDLGKGSCVVPGLIDLHSNLASSFEADEMTESITPQVKAVEAFASDHRDVTRALGSGVTTILIAPGNGNLVAGRPGLIKLNGQRFDKLIFRETVGLKISLTREALFRDREPTSKTGAFHLLREQLRNSKSEVHRLLMEKQEPVFVHAVEVDEIQHALALREEFALKMVLLHADRADELIASIKNADIPIAIGPLRVDDKREKLESAAKLAKAGLRLAFVSDAPVTDETSLRHSAAFAVKYGLDRQEALKALTMSAAEILGIADRVGSIEEGKDADLVVLTGEPLDLTSDVAVVIVDGRIVYERKK